MFQYTDARSISLALCVRERPILIRSSSRRTHGRQLRSEFMREMLGIDGMESPPNPPHLSPRSLLRRLDGRWGNWVFQILLEFQRADLCKPRIFDPVSLPTGYLLIFSLAGGTLKAVRTQEQRCTAIARNAISARQMKVLTSSCFLTAYARLDNPQKSGVQALQISAQECRMIQHSGSQQTSYLWTLPYLLLRFYLRKEAARSDSAGTCWHSV